MSSQLFSSPPNPQFSCTGPLSPYIEPFVGHLLEQGYAIWTVIDKRRVVAKLSRWLKRHRLGVEALDEQHVGIFLGEFRYAEQLHTCGPTFFTRVYYGAH